MASNSLGPSLTGDGGAPNQSQDRPREEPVHDTDGCLPSLRSKIDQMICLGTGRDLKSAFVIDIWPELKNGYDTMRQKLERFCTKALKEKAVVCRIESRTKIASSIIKSLDRRERALQAEKGKQFESLSDVLDEIHDLVGLRIIVEFPDDMERATHFIKESFQEARSPAFFRPDRKVGQSWDTWFGAYQTRNYRLRLENGTCESLSQFYGVMFEIQLTTIAESLYNRLAHPLVYKDSSGHLTRQDEVVMDMTHGLALCYNLCLMYMKDKLEKPAATVNRVARSGLTTIVPGSGTAGEVVKDGTRFYQGLVGNSFDVPLSPEAVKDRLNIPPEGSVSINDLKRWINNKIKTVVYSDEDRRCLRNLRVTDPRHDKSRIEQTKGGLLKGAYRWVLTSPEFQQWRSDEQSRLLWVKGDPGKGKTMLLCGIIDELRNLSSGSRFPAYFFCQATDSRINNASAVLRGLIYMLIDQQPALISHVRKKYDPAGKQLYQDVNAWTALREIFSNMLEDPSLQCSYLIIDALDECTTDLSLLLSLIHDSAAKSSTKWIVSSRNWPIIEKRLDKASQKVRLCLELNEESVSAAVRAYVKFKVDGLAQANDYDSDTQEAVQSYLASKAEGTFLWVALVCQELTDIPGWEAKDLITEFPPTLDALYKRMMDQICKSRSAKLFKSILAVISVVYRPITLDELVSFVDLPGGVSSQSKSLSEIIGLCGSLLTIRNRSIFFVHQSAKDFLLTKAYSEVSPSGIEEIHHTVFSRSPEAMSILQRDIYTLEAPGFPIEQVKQPDPDPLAAVRYSCVYWINHLQDSGTNKTEKDFQDNNVIDKFLRRKYLYWLEALSLLKHMSDGVYSIIKLEGLLQGHASKLADLVRDGRRFIQYHRAIIESNPLQIYASALIFSPIKSPIRERFQAEEPQWLITKPRVDTGWSACLATLEGHSGPIWSIAWSSDGRLASASYNKTIKIWDPTSGQCTATLAGHSGPIGSITWSSDSRLASTAYYDKTIKIWDPATGQCTATLAGHSGPIGPITWSSDGRLASASYDDEIIKIWDPATGQYMATLEGHSDSIESIAWSSDGRLASASSRDETIKIWDLATGQCMVTIEAYTHYLEFDISTPQYLRTSVGTIDLGSMTSRPLDSDFSHYSHIPQAVGYWLTKGKTWITYQGKDLMWLPSDYRPQVSAVSKGKMALGCASGRVLILGLSQHPIL